MAKIKSEDLRLNIIVGDGKKHAEVSTAAGGRELGLQKKC
jgi:hypothetical protein